MIWQPLSSRKIRLSCTRNGSAISSNTHRALLQSSSRKEAAGSLSHRLPFNDTCRHVRLMCEQSQSDFWKLLACDKRSPLHVIYETFA